MFNPNNLVYLGKDQQLDVFLYNGVRIYAITYHCGGSQSLMVGVGHGLDKDTLAGLLAWFGIDQRYSFTRREYPDESWCFSQTLAA